MFAVTIRIVSDIFPRQKNNTVRLMNPRRGGFRDADLLTQKNPKSAAPEGDFRAFRSIYTERERLVNA
jgi:hypothetical protein